MNALQILSDSILRKHPSCKWEKIPHAFRCSFLQVIVFSLFAFQSFASNTSTAFNLNVDLTVYNAVCGQGGNGAVTTTVSGGVPPYTYLWSNGETTTGIVDLSPGTYSVTVTDAMGNTAEETATVIEESPIDLQLNASYETCAGSCDGNVSVNASGGTPPYTYLWNNGDDFVVVYNACAGLYTVTVTDANDCTQVGSIELELSPEGIWLMMSSTPVSCQGASDGTVHVSVMTGVAPFTYDWDSPLIGNSEDGVGLPAGTYCVTVTDVNGCSNSMCVDVEDSNDPCPPCDLDASYTAVNSGCGLNNGSIDLSPSNGSGSFTYNWSNGETTQDLNDLAPGNYTVTITDTGIPNCEVVIGPITVGEDCPPPCDLNITITTVNADCGGTNGSIDLTVSGGSAPYMFIWNDATGSTTEDISGLAPGNYMVTITDSGMPACDTIIGPITVGENTCCDIAATYVVTNSDCGQANGSIDLSPTGGSGSYTFNWSNGETTEDLSGLAPGDYTVTITDASDPACEAIIGSITITEDCCITPVIASVVVVESVCMTATGSATITMAGNNSDFEYEWSPNIGVPNATGNAHTQLPAGTYTVTISNINDALSVCDSLIEIFTVGNTDSPVTTIVSQTPATCNEPNGTVTMSPIDFEYVWCNGETGNNPTMLMAGQCTVTVTDPNTQCTDAFTVVIEEVNPLMLDIVVNNTPDCGMANGSVSVGVSGGSTNYTYAWNDGTSTPDRNDLPSGIYCVTVTDNGVTGCKSDTCFVLIDNVPAGATVTVDQPISISCPGADDAVANYTVTYENGFAFPADTIIKDVDGVIYSNENLAPGDYCIYITDANDCITGSGCFTVEDVPQLDIDIAIDNSCITGPAINLVDVSGGNGGYTFEWSNGDVTQNLEDAGEGTYSVTVSDSRGCSAIADNLILIDTCDCPPILIQSLIVINAECNVDNGSATITMVGNNAIYGYEWTPDEGTPNMTGNARTDLPVGTYEVEISLLNNPHNCPPIKETFTVGGPPSALTTVTTIPDTCNAGLGSATILPDTLSYLWSNGGTGNTQTGLVAGEYYVTVTDTTTNCLGALTVVIGNINTLGVEYEVNNYPDCGEANGSVTINPVNGTGPYEYSWNDGNTNQTRDNLAAGIYCVTVSDLSGTCVGDLCFTLINGNVPGATVEIETPVSVSCPGSTDGMVNYTVTYEPGFIDPADTLIINTSTGDEFANGELIPGNYCIIILDADSCYTGANCFTVDQPNQLDVDIAIDNNCTTGPAIHIVETTGGTPAYTYDWEDIPGDDNPEDRPDLDGGSYDVTITDSNGCTAFANNLIVVDTCACPPLIISSVVVLEAECGMSDGRATVNVVGGASGVTYSWSNGGTTNMIDNLNAGYYSVTIADANRPELCFLVEELTVGTTMGPESAFTSTPASCMGNNGEVTFDNQTYTYDWSDAGTGYERTNLAAGFYSVTITDPANPGCQNVKTVFVEEDAPEFVIEPIITHPTGCTANDGIVTLEVNPPGSYSYSWGNSNTMDNIGPGVYHVTVTDNATGCTKETSFVLSNFNSLLIITIDGEVELNCPGDMNGTLAFTLAGDIINQQLDTVIMDMNGNVMDNGALGSGTYCLQISDMDGCLLNAECFDVKDPTQIDVDIAVFDESCDSLGSIVLVEVIGGAAGYMYNWDPALPNDSTAYNLAPGIYQVSVTDANTCEVSETLEIEEDPNQIDLEVIDITLCTDSLFTPGDQITISPSGVDIMVTNADGDTIDPDLPILPTGNTEFSIQVISGACVTFDTLIVTLSADVNLEALQDSTFCDESLAPIDLTAGCDNCDENDIVWTSLPTGTILGQGPVLENPNSPGEPMEEGVYLASVINADGCEDTDTVTLFLPTFDLAILDSIIICKGDSGMVIADVLNPETYEWEWLGENVLIENNNAAIILPSESQFYTVIYTDLTYGCTIMDSVLVEVVDLDFITATADPTEICIYETSQLNVTEVPGAEYLWRPIDGLEIDSISFPNLQARPLETTTYTVKVTDENECVVERSVEIVVTRPACAPPYVFFPNAFTPNGDGHNDVLYLRGTDITSVHFIIYNRWGEKMFESNSISDGWNGTFRGKELGADVYGYYLTVQCGNGDEYTEKGNVTILK